MAAHRGDTPLLRVRQGDEHDPHPLARPSLLPLRGPLQRGLARRAANRHIRAERVEAEVWEFVRAVLTDPARLTAGLEKMHENEARSSGGASPDEEEGSWLKRISEVERKEERLLDLRLEGDITTQQFRARSAALHEGKEAATTGLRAARSRRSLREDFERDKEVLLEYHARLVPEGLDGLTPEQRRSLYRMMRLRVLAASDGGLTADWGCNVLPTPAGSSPSTTYDFRFRALLDGAGANLEIIRV